MTPYIAVKTKIPGLHQWKDAPITYHKEFSYSVKETGRQVAAIIRGII